MSFNVTDIRPDALMDGQKRAIESDIDTLLSKKDSFVAVSCPACGNSNSKEKFEKNGFKYVECPRCRSFYLSPRPTPEMLEEFLAYSENYVYWSKHIFPASEKIRLEKIVKPRVDQVIELCRKYGVENDALLEVGAGFGTFCEEINKRNCFKRVMAIEPTPTLAESCRQKGIETIEETVERVDHKSNGMVDVVVNFEVIEHLFAPGDFVRHMTKFLRPGGLLILTCPNGQGFDIQTLGSASNTVDHEHLNYFNPASLAYLLTACGLEVLESLTPGKLDAELVRNKILNGEYKLTKGEVFLERILLEEWERLGRPFQDFLAQQGLSSNMWLVARKP